jgi:hypothetical protein
MDPNWPMIEFGKLAKKQGMTQVVKRDRSTLDQVMKFQRRFAKNTAEREELVRRIENIDNEQEQDRRIARIKKLKSFKDDLRIKKKYDQLTREISKVMPRVFREENNSLTKVLFCKLRCFMPKGFFNSIKSILKDNKKGQ